MDRLRKSALQLIFLAIASGCWMSHLAVNTALATVVTLGASKDTTIFQNNPNNGAGGSPGLLAGTNLGPSPRRAMIAFNVSSIPTNATISDVKLRVVIGQIAGSGGSVGSSNPTIDLDKMLVNWGEGNTGASTATNLNGAGQGNTISTGQYDATWSDSFYDPTSPTTWTDGVGGGKPGVDFSSTVSASLVQSNTVNDVSIWDSAGLVADVSGWIQSPASNFGWMLINENETAAQTSRAFYSKDFNPNPPLQNLASFLPQLIVTYTVPEPSAMVLFALAVGCLAPMQWLGRPRRA